MVVIWVIMVWVIDSRHHHIRLYSWHPHFPCWWAPLHPKFLAAAFASERVENSVSISESGALLSWSPWFGLWWSSPVKTSDWKASKPSNCSSVKRVLRLSFAISPPTFFFPVLWPHHCRWDKALLLVIDHICLRSHETAKLLAVSDRKGTRLNSINMKERAWRDLFELAGLLADKTSISLVSRVHGHDDHARDGHARDGHARDRLPWSM